MSRQKQAAGKGEQPSPRLTLCLAIDLKESTASGLKLSTRKIDRFNLALVNQLKPHLEAVELEHALVKFTGDGWLVMSDEQEDAAALCCLAVIMARTFAHDIEREVGLPHSSIPALRLAVCWGRDLPVELYGGQRDFVGSSVRRAVRASQFCEDDEILIDETVRTWVAHDFLTRRADMDERQVRYPNAKMEEDFMLYVLDELKSESGDDADAPVCFVNALAITGRRDEAGYLAGRISDQLRGMAVHGGIDRADLLTRWNQLLASDLDYEAAHSVLSDLVRAGLRPNVATYNALIEKASDDESCRKWLSAMGAEGLSPNEQTFAVLLARASDDEALERSFESMLEHRISPTSATLGALATAASDYACTLAWVDRLGALGIEPDAATYRALVKKAVSFADGRQWIEAMFRRDMRPDESCFIDLFSKDLTGVRADDLLTWYLSLEYHPTHPVKRAIAFYRRKGLVNDALRLTLDYPHTDSALRVIRQYPGQALAYFRSVVQGNPKHPNGTYALGLALVEVGEPHEAEPWLQTAYEVASPGTRKDELARYLQILHKVAVHD